MHKGAKALIDTKAFARDRDGSTYVAPQALVNVDHSMKVMMEETFGPVAGIMKVKDDAEAIRLMNDSPYGLTASIWTRDMDAAERIGREIETGTVYMNRCDYLDPGLAWTGVKDTGRGATLSRASRGRRAIIEDSRCERARPDPEQRIRIALRVRRKKYDECNCAATGTTRPRCASAPGVRASSARP